MGIDPGPHRPSYLLRMLELFAGMPFHAFFGIALRMASQPMVEAYKNPSAIEDARAHEWEAGREMALVGIFKTRFLKRLESSVEAFRLSVRRALVFEETYKDYLLDRRVVSSRDFQKAMRFLARDDEDDLAAGSLADDMDAVTEAREYIESLPTVDLNQYDLRKLVNDVEKDVASLRKLYERTEALAANDGKLERLKELIKEVKGKKVLIFTSFKDTARYLEQRLTSPAEAKWARSAGSPHIRRIDSGNHPDERGRILACFAPMASGGLPKDGQEIDVLISTDVLSEGQNLQDCGHLVNYDLTWNPIRLVQRNGRIDRIGSVHEEVGIYNLFPEDALEKLLHLVERLNQRIETIDDLGLLDASVLGEVVHPRAFNTLRRIQAEDEKVLEEEEARAELAGPEMLLKDLKEMLGRHETEAEELPHGIHSGLRRQKCNGMFFYFQAPRGEGEGRRHFWRYIDATTHSVEDNRFEIARRIACPPDEPRYIGPQDVFALQERMIEHILSAEREVEARAAAVPAVDPIQQSVAETLKDARRRRNVDRDQSRTVQAFLSQPMGKALHQQLRVAYEAWNTTQDDKALLAAVCGLADEFGKERTLTSPGKRLSREDLELICFEYVSA
jgi:superfamily II DNA/RNA helicase